MMAAADVGAAADALDGLSLNNVSPEPAPPAKGEPEACLFVASLNAQRTDDQLTESVTRHFAKWGTLMNVKVMKDWMNRPYAFVQYASLADARRALDESHDTVVDGRHIRVEQARVNRTLFLSKLPKTMADDALRRFLEKWGDVEDVTVLTHPQTGKSKGCAFAKFRYREDAIRAYLHIRQQAKWAVEWASNIERHVPEQDRHAVFVGQLNPDAITEDLLRDRFGGYGALESVHLVAKGTEAFAFLRFEDEDAAQAAVQNENGKEWLDRKIRVQFRETPDTRTPKKPQLSGPASSTSFLPSPPHITASSSSPLGRVTIPPDVLHGTSTTPVLVKNGAGGTPPTTPQQRGERRVSPLQTRSRQNSRDEQYAPAPMQQRYYAPPTTSASQAATRGTRSSAVAPSTAQPAMNPYYDMNPYVVYASPPPPPSMHPYDMPHPYHPHAGMMRYPAPPPALPQQPGHTATSSSASGSAPSSTPASPTHSRTPPASTSAAAYHPSGAPYAPAAPAATPGPMQVVYYPAYYPPPPPHPHYAPPSSRSSYPKYHAYPTSGHHSTAAETGTSPPPPPTAPRYRGLSVGSANLGPGAAGPGRSLYSEE